MSKRYVVTIERLEEDMDLAARPGALRTDVFVLECDGGIDLAAMQQAILTAANSREKR